MDYQEPSEIVVKESPVILKKTKWIPHHLAALNWENDTFPCVQVYVFTDNKGNELFTMPTGAEKRMTKEEFKLAD